MKEPPKEAERGFDSKNEGEGNRTADRHYREAAEKHAKKGENRRAAKRARDALETDEGRELEDARERTKGHEPGSRH